MRFWLLLTLFVSALFGQTITVAASANVSYAMEEIAALYEHRHPGINIQLTIGSSGKLASQIVHGAPYDIFLSADMRYPSYLHTQKVALTQPKIYAYGSLALLSTKTRDFTHPLALLNSEDIKKIAIANPKTAPYGKAALEVLQKTHLLQKVRSKLIYAESIGQSLHFTLKAADIGFVATSTLYAPKMKNFKEGRNWAKLNLSLYTPIAQGAVVLKHAKGTPQVRSFYNFLFSKEAQQILSRYGYTLP